MSCKITKDIEKDLGFLSEEHMSKLKSNICGKVCNGVCKEEYLEKNKIICEKCKKTIEPDEKYYTAIGVIQCAECNTKSGGTISLDFIFNKIVVNEGRKNNDTKS